MNEVLSSMTITIDLLHDLGVKSRGLWSEAYYIQRELPKNESDQNLNTRLVPMGFKCKDNCLTEVSKRNSVSLNLDRNRLDYCHELAFAFCVSLGI